MSILKKEIEKQALKEIKKKIQPTFKSLVVWLRDAQIDGIIIENQKIPTRAILSVLEEKLTESMLDGMVEKKEVEFAQKQAKQEHKIGVLENEVGRLMATAEKLTAIVEKLERENA